MQILMYVSLTIDAASSRSSRGLSHRQINDRRTIYRLINLPYTAEEVKTSTPKRSLALYFRSGESLSAGRGQRKTHNFHAPVVRHEELFFLYEKGIVGEL